jgi:hypothetical protein
MRHFPSISPISSPRNPLSSLPPARVLLGAALLGSSLLSLPLLSGNASAAISYCRTDPIVHLTGSGLGSASPHDVQLTAQVGDGADDVSAVSFVLHVPSGAALKGWTETGGPLKGKDDVTVVADEPAGTYAAQVTVTTGAAAVPVAASMKVPSVGDASASGAANAPLTVSLPA